MTCSRSSLTPSSRTGTAATSPATSTRPTSTPTTCRCWAVPGGGAGWGGVSRRSPLLHNQGGDDLDPNYVLSSRVRTGRSIRGFCLPPHCSRGERRAIEKLAVEGRGRAGRLPPPPVPVRLISHPSHPSRRYHALICAPCPVSRGGGHPAPCLRQPGARHGRGGSLGPPPGPSSHNAGRAWGQGLVCVLLSVPLFSSVESGRRPGRPLLRAQEHDRGGAAAAHRRPLPLR